MRSILSSLLMLSVMGCNSDSSGENNFDAMPHQQNLHALNSISTIELNQTTFIDLSNFIIKNTSENVELTHFDNLNPSGCPDIAPANFGFETISDTKGLCDYRFHVTNAAGEKDSAIVSLLTSNDPLANLAAINIPAYPQGTITINLDDHIENLGNYKINVETLTSEFSPNLASAEMNLDIELRLTDDRKLEFTAPEDLGWLYITYTLKEKAQGVDGKAGYIFVNITDNQAPVIKKEYCIVNQILKKGVYHTIDLSQVTIENEGGTRLIEAQDKWQLSFVFSPSSKVEVSSSKPEDEENKTFTFKATINGSYDVTYAISNHNNGFALGMMQFNVSAQNEPSSFTCK